MFDRRGFDRQLRTLALLIVIGITGWLDYTTGPDIGFSLFYLIPVFISGWLDGVVAANIIAVAGSSAWLIADFLWHPTTPGVSAWNAFTRLIIFIAIGTLTAKVRRNQDRLQAANKELESFTYTVSHDLRSPLLHIGAFASKLDRRSSPSLDGESKRYLATIHDSASMALRLIDELLDFTRLARTDLRRSRIDLGALVDDVRKDLTTNLERPVTWRIDPLPSVDADGPMMRLVLHNLMENAVKYTAPRSDATIEIGSRREQSEVVLYVRDNGVGFDPQYSGKLFQLFERLHSTTEFEGTGIGLAIVDRIIKRHGGRTWAEGEVGRGATFYVSLPVS